MFLNPFELRTHKINYPIFLFASGTPKGNYAFSAGRKLAGATGIKPVGEISLGSLTNFCVYQFRHTPTNRFSAILHRILYFF
jgi:hypothetical protein